MKWSFRRSPSVGVLRTMSVTDKAVLPVREETVLFVSGLRHAERRRLGTRAGTRSLGCFKHAILVLRRLLDGTRVTQLALDNQISRSTGYGTSTQPFSPARACSDRTVASATGPGTPTATMSYPDARPTAQPPLGGHCPSRAAMPSRRQASPRS